MSPAGGDHGRVAMRIGSLLDQHVRRSGSGTVFAAETGFILSRDPDTVLAPDVAFVSSERLAGLKDTSGYLELAPDLAVEVISPTDTFTEVEKKASIWLQAGTRMVLLVDPAARSVYVYRGRKQVVALDESDELEADDVVPGWRVLVGTFFE